MIPRNVRLLYYLGFLTSFKFYDAILIIYFVQVTGSYAFAMSLIATVKISQAVLEIPTGVYSDMIGRKNTFILAIVVSIFATILFALSRNYTFLMIAVVLSGMSEALNSGNNNALLYDSLKEKNLQDDYHHYLGKNGSIILTGFGLAALVGGFIASVSFPLAIWLSVIPLCLALLISFSLDNPPTIKKVEVNPYVHIKESLHLFITNPRLRMLSLSNTISSSIIESTYILSTTFVNMLWPLWAVGIMKSGTNFANAFSHYISGRVIGRFGAFNALVCQFIFSRGVNILAYVFPTTFSPLLMLSGSFVFGIGQVSQGSLLQNEFTDHQRATMGSLNSLMNSLGFALVSILIGYFADRVGTRNILLIGEILLLPVLLIYWRLFLHNREHKLIVPKIS